MGLNSKAAKVTIAAAVGAAAVPIVVPAAVAIAGFGAAGITAGSWAAALMASYGGMVPAGSLCAVLQSVGAGGLATSTVLASEGVAAAFAGMSAFFYKRRPPPAGGANAGAAAADGDGGVVAAKADAAAPAVDGANAGAAAAVDDADGGVVAAKADAAAPAADDDADDTAEEVEETHGPLYDEAKELPEDEAAFINPFCSTLPFRSTFPSN